MNQAIHIQELARQVRSNTLQLLTAAPEAWLTWAPEGTSNHILWHAGHALWVQDVLSIQPLTCNASELPNGWAETFGSDCRPVSTTTDWPHRDQIQSLLESQQARLLELFETHAERLARIGPDPPSDWDLTRGVIHGLHDEARHQGEMHLLLKLCRAHLG